MKFRPLHDRVVVRRIEEDDRTKGGIIIPDTAKEKPQQGEVVAVGPGAPDEKGKVQPLDVKPGDRVLFGKWSGTEVKLDGEELLDHEGERHHGRARRRRRQEEGRLTNILILRRAAAGQPSKDDPAIHPCPSRLATRLLRATTEWSRDPWQLRK